MVYLIIAKILFKGSKQTTAGDRWRYFCTLLVYENLSVLCVNLPTLNIVFRRKYKHQEYQHKETKILVILILSDLIF